MNKNSTARDVAELAGVSRTTVSFVLNDVAGMRISEETRARVRDAAQQLDYHPDVSAQRLVTGRTGILAYVERQNPEDAFSDAFLPQVLRGVNDAAKGAGFETMFAPVPLAEGAGRIERLLRGKHVDGIILSGPRADDASLRRLLQAGAPIVLQGSWPGVSVASVDIDNVAAARRAVDHLLALGYRELGMIVHAPLEFTAAASRLQGYREAVAGAGRGDLGDRFTVAAFTPLSGERAMESLLDQGPPLEAVFVSSDTVAVGALLSLRRRGLRVPQDVAVIGFDDIPMAIYLDPSLTTIRLPAYGLGWGAAELAIRLVSGDQVHQRHIILDSELVVRTSCGAAGRNQITASRPDRQPSLPHDLPSGGISSISKGGEASFT